MAVQFDDKNGIDPKLNQTSTSDQEPQLDQSMSRGVGDVEGFDPHHDAVFGDIGEGGPNYRNVC